MQDLNLPALFALMEEAREAMHVEEYSVSQTTLEHVFIALADVGREPAEHIQSSSASQA